MINIKLTKEELEKKYSTGKINIYTRKSKAIVFDYIKSFYITIITLGVINYKIINDDEFDIMFNDK